MSPKFLLRRIDLSWSCPKATVSEKEVNHPSEFRQSSNWIVPMIEVSIATVPEFQTHLYYGTTTSLNLRPAGESGQGVNSNGGNF